MENLFQPSPLAPVLCSKDHTWNNPVIKANKKVLIGGEFTPTFLAHLLNPKSDVMKSWEKKKERNEKGFGDSVTGA